MNDVLVISEDLMQRVLQQLNELRRQTGEVMRIDLDLLHHLLAEQGWEPPQQGNKMTA